MKKKILIPLLSVVIPLTSATIISCGNNLSQEQNKIDLSLYNFKFKNNEGKFVDSSQIDILKVIRENIQFDIKGEDANNYNIKISKLKPDLDSKILNITFELRDKESNEIVGETSKMILGFLGSKSGLTFKNFKIKSEMGIEQNPSQVLASSANPLNIIYEAEGSKLEFYDHKISNAREFNGDLKVFIDITLKGKSDVIETIEHVVTGFKKDAFNQSLADGKKEYDITSYLKLTQEERFEQDNSEYLRTKKGQIGKELQYYRKLLNRDKDSIARFDQKAQELGIDSYENLLAKNFSLPNKEGKKLEIFDEGARNLGPSKTDAFGVANSNLIGGLARKLINDKYKDIALQTFAISFTNREERNLQDRVNDIDEAFKKAEPKLKEVTTLSSNSSKKDLIVHLNNIYIKINIARKLAKKQNATKDIKNKLEEIIKEYEDKLKEFPIFSHVSKEPFNNETFNTKSEESLFKRHEYKDFEKDSFVQRITNGTIWILDAEKKEGSSYPTKFFFGTNVHVADALTKDTVSVSISRANKDIPIKQELKPIQNDPRFETFIFSLHKQPNLKVNVDKLVAGSAANAIKNIFLAKDYLKSKPSDFLIKSQEIKYQNTEEFADFAVIGIDFEQIKNLKDITIHAHDDNGLPSDIKEKDKVLSSAQSLAKYFTNDYASTENTGKQIKLLKESYLKNYDKIDTPLSGDIPEDKDTLYLLGYPSTQFDYYLTFGDKKYSYKKYTEEKEYKQSLWINASSDFDSTNDINHETGSRLSYQIGLRTFKDKPGIVDAFLATPNDNGRGFHTSPDGKQYINMGLEYTPRFYAPGGGASGSSLRNQNNEVIGAFHYKYGQYGDIGTGLAIALRSEGFNYQGLFGDYNLPQYDLIYGKGKDQKNSYREELKKHYPNIKTLLLPDGTAEDKIPSDFHFEQEEIEDSSKQ